jgi:hypothetical protein
VIPANINRKNFANPVFSLLLRRKNNKTVTMYNDLSKSQQKIARKLIDKGVENGCENCIQKIKSLLVNNKNGAKSNHDLYIEIYKLINQFDERHDDLGKSEYFYAVLRLYINNIFSDEDLKDFDENVRTKLTELKKLIE